MSVKVLDLCNLQLNLLIEINFLLSDHVQLSDLLVDNLLAFFKCICNLLNLGFDLIQLLLSVKDHLVEVLNLIIKMVDNSLLLVLFVDLLFNIVSHLKELCLLDMDCLHLFEQIVDLIEVSLSLGVLTLDISDVQLQLALQVMMTAFKLVLRLTSLLLGFEQLSVELFYFAKVLLLLVGGDLII